MLYTTAFVFEAPISTTHIITSAVMGVGATKRFSAVRWGVARSIVTAWVLTFPAAGLVAAGCYWLCHLLIGSFLTGRAGVVRAVASHGRRHTRTCPDGDVIRNRRHRARSV